VSYVEPVEVTEHCACADCVYVPIPTPIAPTVAMAIKSNIAIVFVFCIIIYLENGVLFTRFHQIFYFPW
jgi:hypothetical protein